MHAAFFRQLTSQLVDCKRSLVGKPQGQIYFAWPRRRQFTCIYVLQGAFLARTQEGSQDLHARDSALDAMTAGATLPALQLGGDSNG
jgi:hypothetical protein